MAYFRIGPSSGTFSPTECYNIEVRSGTSASITVTGKAGKPFFACVGFADSGSITQVLKQGSTTLTRHDYHATYSNGHINHTDYGMHDVFFYGTIQSASDTFTLSPGGWIMIFV